MQLKTELCKGECGEERPIVNRKYGLCDACNYKRLNGRSKQEVYKERSDNRMRTTAANNSLSKTQSSNRPRTRNSKVFGGQKKEKGNNVNALKKQFSIKKISSVKKYRTSDGTLVSQVEINRRLTEAKDRLQFEREPVCAATGSTEFPLSWSHTISVARAKELGKAELIWDPDNLELEGYHERASINRAGHNIWEDGTWQQKIGLLNIERKLNYIRKHDAEQYRSIMAQLEGLEKGLE